MDFYFLLFSLFFPRITLFVYFVKDAIPLNTIPFIGDVLLSIIFPRLLILIYIYQNMGYDNVWFIVHLIAFVLTFSGGSSQGRKRYKARKSE